MVTNPSKMDKPDEFAHHITNQELQKSFDRLKHITSKINEFLWSVIYEDGYEDVFYTESIIKITGYSPDEIKNLPGRGLSLIHSEDSFDVRKRLSDFEKDVMRDSISLIYRIFNKKKEVIWVKESITIERDGNGIIKRYDGIVSDITELKKTEFALKKSEESLRQLNEAKDRFISIVSHDLRAPFTSILGFAEILLNESALPETEKQEYLNYIYESSQSQLQLVNYLLDWSRLQTGRMKMEPQRIKIKTIVYNSISSLTGNAIRKNIDIKMNIPDDIFILADERLVNQAITNLISNAIKFSPEHKEIEINAGIFKKGLVEFSIKDEGVGISEANKNKIFKFDQKFSLEGTKGEKGSGLGLTLVKEIIEKHGGEIWFYSEINKGSEFHFTVPEAPNLALLVEDDSRSMVLWRKLINKHLPHFDVIETVNGFEAMSIILNKIPAFVITDHDMPLMNGIQLIESMRKKDESNKIPVVVVSEIITDDLVNKYQKLGVERILQKPIDTKLFAETLHLLVD